MRFYYTCTYVPKQTRRLETVEFSTRAVFEDYLAMWNRNSFNNSNERVFIYEEGTPVQLIPPLVGYTNFAVGTTGWLQKHAQHLANLHRERGNAHATDYLLRIIREFQAEEAKQ